jgi:hypothetical protein
MRRADGSFVSNPPPPVGAKEAGSQKCQMAGPRSPAPRPRARKGAPVLRHHSH